MAHPTRYQVGDLVTIEVATPRRGRILAQRDVPDVFRRGRAERIYLVKHEDQRDLAEWVHPVNLSPRVEEAPAPGVSDPWNVYRH